MGWPMTLNPRSCLCFAWERLPSDEFGEACQPLPHARGAGKIPARNFARAASWAPPSGRVPRRAPASGGLGPSAAGPSPEAEETRVPAAVVASECVEATAEPVYCGRGLDCHDLCNPNLHLAASISWQCVKQVDYTNSQCIVFACSVTRMAVSIAHGNRLLHRLEL